MAKPRAVHLDRFLASVAHLARGGLPLHEAVRYAARSSPAKDLASRGEDVARRMKDGESLSEAMRAHEAVFGERTVTCIHHAEQGGDVVGTLAFLAQDAHLSGSLRRLVRTVFGFTFLYVLVLCTIFSLAAYWVALASPGNTTDLLSSETHTWGMFSLMIGGLILGALTGLLLVPTLLRALVKGVSSMSPLLLKLPIVGNIWNDVILVRFASHLALSVRSGMPLTDSLPPPEALTLSTHVRREIRQMGKSLSEGEDMASAIVATGFFPNRLAWIFTRSTAPKDVAGLLLTFAEECRERVEAACGRLLRAAPSIGLVFALLVSVFILTGGLSGLASVLTGGYSSRRFDRTVLVAPAVLGAVLGVAIAIFYAVTEWRFKREGVSADVATALGTSADLGLPVTDAAKALAHHAYEGPRREIHEALARLAEKPAPDEAEDGKRKPHTLLGILCRLGRRAGRPAEALAFYARRIRLSLRARHSMIAEAQYPFLVAVAFAFISLHLRMIVVRFSFLYGMFPFEEVAAWQSVYTLSGIIGRYYLATAVLFGVLILFSGPLSRFVRARAGWAARLAVRVFARLPVIGRYVRNAALADLAFSLGLMIEGGRSTAYALNETMNSGTALPFRKQIAAMRVHVEEGGSLSSFARQSGAFPKKFAAALAATEGARRPGSDLIALSEAYLTEAGMSAAALSASVMPVMLVVTGGLMALHLIALAKVFYMIYPFLRGTPW